MTEEYQVTAVSLQTSLKLLLECLNHCNHLNAASKKALCLKRWYKFSSQFCVDFLQLFYLWGRVVEPSMGGLKSEGPLIWAKLKSTVWNQWNKSDVSKVCWDLVTQYSMPALGVRLEVLFSNLSHSHCSWNQHK